IVRYCIRALRTDAQPSGTAVSRSSGSSSGCRTPRVPAAASMPTTPVSTSTACRTTRGADVMPRVCARWRSSRKSESSSAARCTAVVASYSRSSASRLTCGSRRACAQPAPACTADRSATAPATSASEGSASRTLSGVGPALNSAVSTPVAASSQNAVKIPATRLRATVAAVSRGLARQASRAAWTSTAGSRRATVTRPVSASSRFLACQVTAASSGSPDAGRSTRRRRLLLQPRLPSRLPSGLPSEPVLPANRRRVPMRRPPSVPPAKGQCATRGRQVPLHGSQSAVICTGGQSCRRWTRGTCRKSKVYGMTDGWPEGWTRKEDDRVARSRERYVRAEHHQPAAAGRERHGDPYDDPYAGDQLRGAGRYDHGDPYGDPYGGPPPRRRRRRRGGRVFGAVLVVLLLVLVGGYFYLDSRLNREAVLVDYPGRVADTPGTNWLIVGSDSREGLSREDQKRLRTGRAAGRRTDSMMLLHYGSGGTSLISLPRDSYVAIPGKGRNKLNAAFAF